jgi:hypothetical protein
MEPDPRTPSGPDRLRSLNLPRRLQVRPPRGLPQMIRWRGRWRQVTRIGDSWQVDEGWWRASPISRLYLRVELAGDLQLTIYQDLEDHGWWSQLY